MKKALFVILVIILCLFFVSCSHEQVEEPDETQYQIYQLALSSGFDGTYEEWLESIKGENGKPIELIVENGILCWRYIGEIAYTPLFDLNDLIGDKGDQGEKGEQGVSITKVEKTSSDGLVDTYTITFSNGTTTTYTVNNGANGLQGDKGEQGIQGEKGEQGVSITKVEKTSSDGLVDTYTITFSNGTTTTYTVNNGVNGSQGETGNGIVSIDKTSSPDSYTDVYTITFTDGTTYDFVVTNGKPLDEIKYEIIFDSDGGSEVANQEIHFGYKINKPTNPTKDGYIFDGWYIEDEKWIFSNGLVTEPMTLKAKWELANYNITYNYNGGEEVTESKLKYTLLDEDIILPTPNRFGYEFTGWYDNIELTGKPIEKITQGSFGDKVFYASWKAKTHKIKFMSNGGTEYEDLNFDFNANVELPIPTRSGYKFLFWSDDENMLKAYDETYTEDTDLVLYARWLVDGMSTYTVEVYLQNEDGTYSLSPSDILTYEAQTETMASPILNTYNGYDLPNVNPTGLVVGDGSLKLKAFYPIKTYTLYVDYVPYELKYGEKIENLEIPNKTGYTFTGWNTEVPEFMPNYNLYIYATWQANVYKVSFDTNGNDEVIEPINVIYNQTLDLPIPVALGYEFNGWYYNNIKVEGTWTLTSDVTLKAHWATKYEDFTFELVDGSYEVKAYLGYESNIIIPNAINGIPVTSIGNEAFKDNNTIETIELQNNISNIGDNAFMNMSALKELKIRGLISTFGSYVLKDTKITNISLVTGDTILLGLFDFEESNMPDNLIITLSYNNDIGKVNGLKNILTKNYTVILDNTFNNIPDYMFNNCTTLTDVLIPDTVVSIGSEAFAYCESLKNINIPNSVNSINYYAFGESGLTSVVIPNSVTYLGQRVFISCENLEFVVFSNGLTTIPHYTFRSTKLKCIVIPNTIKTIVKESFENTSLDMIYYTGSKSDWYNIEIGGSNQSLTNANIIYNFDYSNFEYVETDKYSYFLDGNNIYHLKCLDKTIENCHLSELEGYNVKSLGLNSFGNCEKLVNITITNNVNYISNYSFSCCYNLTNVYYNGTIEEWSNIIFGDSSYLMHYAKHLFVLNENNEYVEVDLSQLQ